MGIVLFVTDLDIWELFCLLQIKIYGNCFVCNRSRYMGIVLSVTDLDIWELFCRGHIKIYWDCFVCDISRYMGIVLSMTYIFVAIISRYIGIVLSIVYRESFLFFVSVFKVMMLEFQQRRWFFPIILLTDPK